MARVKVRLTLRPDEDWEVDEDEVPSLRHQGLLVESAPAEVKTPAAKATEKQGA